MPIEDLDLLPPTVAQTRPRPIHNIPDKLASLDLERELLEHYWNAKTYLDDIQYVEGTSPNQVAQVINAITSSLKDVIKLQAELYNIERLKKLEEILVSTVKTCPPEIQDAFLTRYNNELQRTL